MSLRSSGTCTSLPLVVLAILLFKFSDQQKLFLKVILKILHRFGTTAGVIRVARKRVHNVPYTGYLFHRLLVDTYLPELKELVNDLAQTSCLSAPSCSSFSSVNSRLNTSMASANILPASLSGSSSSLSLINRRYN